MGSAREHAPVDRELGIRIRVEEERNRTRAAKVQAGQRIAQVLEQADGEAAQRYRGRLDDATRATADAEGRATLATEERDEARRERDRAAEQRDRARATGEFTSELVVHLQRDNERLKRAEQVWEKRAAAQVAAAKQASADELTRVQQDVMAVRRERTEAIEQVGTLTAERDQARRERGQAAQEVKTVSAERDQAREDLAKRTAEVEDVKTDRNEWIDCFVRVVRSLDPGRTELEKAAARGGIKPEWLVQEVQRGRGGIDR